MSIRNSISYLIHCKAAGSSKGLLASSLASLVLLGTPAAFASVPNTWYAAEGQWLYADDTCTILSEDCNVCAPDIEGQWADMAAGALSWRERSWHFGWERAVAPSGLKPSQAWDADGILKGDYESHAQGFVRTNHPWAKYAMSHNDEVYGSLTFVDYRYDIYAMHRTASHHPSGIFTLGLYVGMVDGRDSVRFFDTRRALESHDLRFGLGPQGQGRGVRDGNGGIAMAKLRGGGYLLVVGDGGENNTDQKTEFYFVDGPLTAPARKQFLGVYDPPNLPQSQSENISMLTECGTGHIYTVHTMGDKYEGQGYYVLAKVTWGAIGPTLTRVDAKIVNSHNEYCHHRSAASASVRSNGYVDLLCHERAEDNGVLSGQGDDWDFREGLNYY
jgi:hypothetical protein